MLKKLLATLVLAALAIAAGIWWSQPELEEFRVAFVPASLTPPPSTFVAGAATVDITPPPGSLPRAGYATWSNTGQGFRTRLYARAYYMRDQEGDAHMVIQTDLTSGSRILHTRLGELLASQTDIDAGNLTLTATHSHSAPGQVLGSQFYNRHISNQTGFAQGYFEFLVSRIGEAAMEAYRNRQPAQLATGHTEIWGLTRNRSVPAYVANSTVARKGTGDHRAYHNINPRMHMVRIDRITETGETRPLAAFASFGIHGTALPRQETLFNADVWAYIHKDWERAIDSEEPVHVSAFEGAHGDVAPASRFGMLGYIEARRVGQAIGKETIQLYRTLGDSLTSDVNLGTATRHINIRQKSRIGNISICEEPFVGNTLAAGPEEHTSPVIGHLPFIRQGSRRSGDEQDNCQGRKRILGFSWGQPLIEPTRSFPDYVLFQVVQINDLLMVPLPFELTTEAGRRVAESVKEGFRKHSRKPPEVMITSLAGGYTGYVTTPEEYGRQYYEGGHTLYGKYSLPYLAAQVGRLTQDMLATNQRLVDVPEGWTYAMESRRFLPSPLAAQGERAVIRDPQFTHPRGNREGEWHFQWRDVNPSGINLHEPLLSIEIRKKGGSWQPLTVDGVAVDDEGYDLAVRLSGETDENGMSVYTGHWYNPVFAGEDRDYRFVVAPRGNLPVFYSPAFH